MDATRWDVVVVGAGAAGLIAARRLQERGVRFVVLDGGDRIGDVWRQRYASLRLFSYRRYSSLPGLRMPIGRRDCPTALQMADHLEAYAAHFALPVRLGSRVERISRSGEEFSLLIRTADGTETVRAGAVIVATGGHRRPVRPPFADRLDPRIRQVHSLDLRSVTDLPEGPVLVVGAGNSGTDIALEAAAAGRETVLAGRHPGQTPFRLDSVTGFVGAHGFLFVLRHLTVRSSLGRRARARLAGHGLMLIRNKLADLDAAGVRRTGRIVGVESGLPVTDDGDVLRPAAVVWCTGSRPDLAWLDLDGALDGDGEPRQTEGVADTVPGLGFVGLDFQYSAASGTIQGMDSDARAVVRAVLRNQPAAEPVPAAVVG